MTTLTTPERRGVNSDDRDSPLQSTSRSTQNISTPSPRQQSTPQLTVEAVMSNANGNAVVALENVLAERNMLSSQNTQLWKLIEKQRAVHGNAMKELERVRAERDRALVKLDPERAYRRVPAHRSSSSSTAGPSAGTRLADSPSPGPERQNGHRYPMIRHQSDDVSLSSPRASTPSFPALSASRSHEPLRQSEQQPPPPSESFTVELLTVPATNGTYQHSSEATSAAPTPLPSLTESLFTSDSAPVVSSSSSTQPLQVNKLQLPSAPTTTQVSTADNQSQDDTTVVAPVLATPPPEVSAPVVHTAVRQSSLPLSDSQSLVTPAPSLSVPFIQNRQLARESRITLPDEARRYIANMQESPMPSPSSRQATFTAGTLNGRIVEEPASFETNDGKTQNFVAVDANNTSIVPGHPSHQPSDRPPTQASDARPNDQPGEPSAFLELNGDDDESDSAEMALNDPNTPMPPFSPLDTTFGIRTSPSPPQQECHSLPADSSVPPQSMYSENFSTRSQPSLVTHEHDPTTSRDIVLSGSNMETRSLNVPSSPITAGPSHSTPPPMAGTSPAIIRAQAPSATTQAQVQAQRMAYAQAHGHDYNSSVRGQSQPQPQIAGPVYSNPNARARLTESDLPHCRVSVVGSNIRANERGKEVLSFVVQVTPSGSPDAADSWKVEKLYSEVLSLDARIRGRLRRHDLKKLGSLPDSKLFKDHAPAKVDQRKAVLENYLQTVVKAQFKDMREACEFFSTDVMNEASAPVTQSGYKEGYLTKRGKNFGGWKTRYFVLQGPVLEYYESRGGTHLGSINITGAQIGRQQKTSTPGSSDDENEYRHAFLIIESKKGASVQHTRHVLCAESDAERDSWVDVLVRYVMGSYDDTGVSATTSASAMSAASTPSQPRPSTSSITSIEATSPKRMIKADIAKGSAVPISQLSQDQMNAKLFQSAPIPDTSSTTSSPMERHPPPVDRSLQAITEVPLSSSLPTHLDVAGGGGLLSQRAASELGHYPDLTPGRNPATYHDARGPGGRPDRMQMRSSVHPSLSTVQSSPTFPTTNGLGDRAPSPDPSSLMPPDASSKVKISGPINGTPIPAGYKFGAKDTSPDLSNSERDRKAKSRNFWGFGRVDKAQAAGGSFSGVPSRAVFAIPISDSLMVAQIANLPAVVFRCIQYLEAKKADQEEGIYRLSGSSAVIKSLRDRFNTEGDVDLLASDEFWDPHAIAGLLKSFLRELPTSILTRDLHLRFLAVIDLTDTHERVNELAQLISQLPLPNYSLLRALTAHLILIVQNASVNKMTMRNVGIVFSPTLGIPAGVFSLMLGEFNRVFNVDGDTSDTNVPASTDSEPNAKTYDPIPMQKNRNSRSYADGAADKMLGLAGRSLKPPGEDSDSADDVTMPDSASGTETETDPDATATYNQSTGDLANGSPVNEHRERANSASQADIPPRATAKAATMAAMRGLHISTDRRRSAAPGLPHSPRPAGKSTPPYAVSMSGSAPNTPH